MLYVPYQVSEQVSTANVVIVNLLCFFSCFLNNLKINVNEIIENIEHFPFLSIKLIGVVSL